MGDIILKIIDRAGTKFTLALSGIYAIYRMTMSEMDIWRMAIGSIAVVAVVMGYYYSRHQQRQQQERNNGNG